MRFQLDQVMLGVQRPRHIPHRELHILIEFPVVLAPRLGLVADGERLDGLRSCAP